MHFCNVFYDAGHRPLASPSRCCRTPQAGPARDSCPLSQAFTQAICGRGLNFLAFCFPPAGSRPKTPSKKGTVSCKKDLLTVLFFFHGQPVHISPPDSAAEVLSSPKAYVF